MPVAGGSDVANAFDVKVMNVAQVVLETGRTYSGQFTSATNYAPNTELFVAGRTLSYCPSTGQFLAGPYGPAVYTRVAP